MHLRCLHPRTLALGLMCTLLFSLTCFAQLDSRSKPVAPQRELTPEENEQIRIVEIMEWARKNRVPADQVSRKIMEPIILGNQHDIEWNKKMGDTFSERAAAARKDGRDGPAKEFATVAALFNECSKENANVLKALKAGDVALLRAALEKLKRYDKRIEEVSGEKLRRRWVVLDEMIMAMAVPPNPSGTPASPTPVPRQR